MCFIARFIKIPFLFSGCFKELKTHLLECVCNNNGGLFDCLLTDRSSVWRPYCFQLRWDMGPPDFKLLPKWLLDKLGRFQASV